MKIWEIYADRWEKIRAEPRLIDPPKVVNNAGRTEKPAEVAER
jgi:hypothetical protein